MSECKHERYNPDLHTYCMDCGQAGVYVEVERLRAENERLQWLHAEKVERLRAEIKRLRSLLERARPFVLDAYVYGIIRYSDIDSLAEEIDKELREE